MTLDWVSIWAVVGPAVVGLATWLKTRKPNQAAISAAVSAARAEAVNTDSTSAAVALLRGEVERLGARQQAMETREGKLIRHLWRLEALMRAHGIEPPPFDIDGEPIRAGGTD
jgi:hypothetical protein